MADELLSDADIGLVGVSAPRRTARNAITLPSNNATGLLSDADVGLTAQGRPAPEATAARSSSRATKVAGSPAPQLATPTAEQNAGTEGGFLKDFTGSLKEFDLAEGMVGRAGKALGEWLAEKVSGVPREQMVKAGYTEYTPKETPTVEIGDAVKQLIQYAKEHPGATVAEFVKGAAYDPWMFLVPEFGARTKLAEVLGKIGSRVGPLAGKAAALTGATAGAGLELGAVGAGAEAAAQVLEVGAGSRQSMSGREVATAGAMWGGLGALTTFVRGMPELFARAKAGGKVGEAAVDEILKGYKDTGEAPADVTRQHVKEAISKLTRGMTDTEIRAEQKAYDLVQSGASKKAVEAVRAKDPLVGEMLDKLMGSREYWTRESGMARGEQLLGPDATAKMPSAPILPQSFLALPSPKNPPRTESGRIDNDLLLTMGIASGLAGAGLWVYTHPEATADIAAGLSAAGVLATTKGHVAKIFPVDALGTLLKNSQYTTKTFDRLPQGRTEFPVKMIQEQLNRPDVSKAERDLIQAAVGKSEEAVIPAAELVKNFRLVTGDYALTRRPVDTYADYGLENIGRGVDLPFWDRADARLGETFPGVENTSSNLYRLPDTVEVPATNHFGDKNLYGWTRTFDQEGKRHVVEIQSDLAQHQKALTPEVRQDLENKLVAAETNYKILKDVEAEAKTPEGALALVEEFTLPVRRGETSQQAIKWALAERAAKLAEIKAKLSGGKSEAIQPILKNWERRLVREELGHAATERAQLLTEAIRSDTVSPERAADLRAKAEQLSSVRFATADTVAEVEGWPRPGRMAQSRVDRRNAEIASGSVLPEEVSRYLDVNLNDQSIVDSYKSSGLEFKPEHQGIYNRYKKDVEKYLYQLGGKSYTDPQGVTWIEVPTGSKGPVQMFGRADPKLLTTIALVGGGAILGATLAEENKVLAGIMGAGAAAAAPYMLKHGLSGLDRVAGILSTQMRNISPVIADRLAVDYERNVLMNAHKYLTQVDPFLRKVATLESEQQSKLASAIFSGDREATTGILRSVGDPGLARNWLTVRSTLDEIGKELKSRGRISALQQDYFPRIVTDLEGLLKHLGITHREGLDKVLHAAQYEAARNGVQLSAAEESKIINQWLSRQQWGGKPGFTKERRIDTLPEELLPFYASPVESLHSYIRSAVTDIEKAKFFGKHLQTRNGQFMLDDSVGALVREELTAGNLDPARVDDLHRLLLARFGPGEKGANPTIQAIKNTVYAGLLGNFKAALTQVGDVPVSIYLHGMNPTLSALAQRIRGTNPVSAKDFGLVDHLAEEFANTDLSAKMLNKLYKGTLFTGVDLFAKDVNLTASLARHAKLAQTPEGQAFIENRWGHRLEKKELQKLYSDLSSGRITEDVQALLWADLIKAQPITRSELPPAYLENPNGRVLYMLRTYTLKQFDLMRNDAYNKIRAGQVREGLGNLAKYATTMTVSGIGIGAVKDWIEGRPVEITPAIAENMLKTFGWSQYSLDKVKEGKPGEALAGMVAPPYKMMDDIIQRKPEAMRYIPFVGPWAYAHTDAAKVKEEKRQQREQRKREKESLQ